MRLQAGRGQPKKEAEYNALRAMRQESSAHLLVCPSLLPSRPKHDLECLKEGQVYHSEPLARSLAGLFKLKGFHDPTSYSPVEKSTRAVKGERSPDKLAVPSASALPLAALVFLRCVGENDLAEMHSHCKQAVLQLNWRKRGQDRRYDQNPLLV
ncbi:unnamed protein product [Trypanosoma congolense IL3000]|uniref:WGS project CAEQ00000000 data, annotated contig 2041 n=1 Tax=Trypanosoma congolense (strain IL3000) TaxID=1068625 RepID=F9WAZ6_TRYCI|nr:unnamed protein product [Trypanosoma congolense IL3000]